jgi:hypothetical protein
MSSHPRPSAPVAVRADDRPWRYAQVGCLRCGAVVQVAKFSLPHTSVQWTADAVARCAEFAASAAEGRASALIPACASLRASIDDAVAGGRVEVLPP